jgi:hypothetical protein
MHFPEYLSPVFYDAVHNDQYDSQVKLRDAIKHHIEDPGHHGYQVENFGRAMGLGKLLKQLIIQKKNQEAKLIHHKPIVRRKSYDLGTFKGDVQEHMPEVTKPKHKLSVSYSAKTHLEGFVDANDAFGGSDAVKGNSESKKKEGNK